MKELTVKQLAATSGVTVRTLHHYDEIGLLKPSFIGTNGYRYYGRKEMLRLQQILFHRELGVPLGAIAELLEVEGEDQIGILRCHRERLEAERERYRVLIETIDRTIEELKGEAPLSNADLYKGFSPERQTRYETWLSEQYGEWARKGIARAKSSYANLSRAEQEGLGKELQDLEEALASAMRNGVDPTANVVARLIERHRAWVATMWGQPCSAERYLGLADLYLTHPDFVARFERIATGFAEYLAGAMRLHASKGDGLPMKSDRSRAHRAKITQS